MTETRRRSDVRARAVFGHRVVALAALATVVLAFFLTLPALVSEPVSIPFTRRWPARCSSSRVARSP